jgi:hypothetical protein
MSLGGVIGGWPKREITKYRTERIVRSEPEDKSAQTPGLLCWGDAGTLPAPVPVSTGFEIVKSEHVEKSRETELVNIYDQNNPDNYITAARTKRMLFDVTDNTNSTGGNNNTSTGGTDLSDFEDSGVKTVDLTPKGTNSKKSQLKVTFSNNDGTI